MSQVQSFFISGFLNFAGPITFLAFLFWMNSIYALFGPLPAYFRENWRPWGLAFLGAAIVFASTKIDFKVLSDETNLLSVANMLTAFGKASNTEMWQYYYHSYHALDVSVPSRPLLFPVFTSVVQLAVGIRWWAPFVVNFISLWILFGLVLRWAEKTVPSRLYPLHTAFLMLLMSPILSISATSAGFDLVSLTVGFSCFLILLEYEKRRDSAALECLLYGLICFASVRYESIVALPFTAAGLLLLEGKGLLKKLEPHALVAAFIMILPLIVQRVLTWGSFENPPDVPPFSPMHALHHFRPFVQSFFLNGNGPYPVMLHWLGLAGLVVAVKNIRSVGIIPAVFSGFVWVLLLSHHFGFADHPTQARLFMPISFSLVLLAIYLLNHLEKYVDARYLMMVFAVLCFHHREYAIHDPLMSQLTMTREVRHIRDFIDAESTMGDLWVYDRPGQLSALGRSAISWNEFNAKTDSYFANLKVSLYTRMLVIERVPIDSKKQAEFKLDRPKFTLVPLRSHELGPDEVLRISQLIPKLEPVEAAAKKP